MKSYFRFNAILSGIIALSATNAYAQASSVTLYGVVDAGIEYVNHIGPAGHDVVRMNNLSGSVPSRWGIRGVEDLGGGLKAVFALESGFSPDSGTSNQGGRMFGRQAWVGLNSSKWGQLSFGRQYTMTFWSMLDSDMLGPNTFGSASLDVYLPNARSDNTVAYKGTFGGVTIGATYSLGRDAVNAGPGPAGTNCAGENPSDTQACRAWSAMVKYDAATWSLGASYDSIRGGNGAYAGLTSSGMKDDRLAISGYANVAAAKIGGGVVLRDNEASPNSRSDLWFGGVSYAATPAFSVDAELFYLRFHHSADKAWLYAMRGTYAFSKRTSVYATVGYIDNHGNLNLSVSSGATGSNPTPGGNQLGALVGLKQVF